MRAAASASKWVKAAMVLAVIASAVFAVPVAGAAADETHEKIIQRVESMPPEQREEAKRHLQDIDLRKASLRSELKNLPPGRRAARMSELQAEYEANRAERHEKFRHDFQQRWDGASAEERAAFCGNTQRCREKPSQACDFILKACAEAKQSE